MPDFLTKVIATLEDSKVRLKAEQDKLKELADDNEIEQTDHQEYLRLAASNVEDANDLIDAAIKFSRKQEQDAARRGDEAARDKHKRAGGSGDTWLIC